MGVRMERISDFVRGSVVLELFGAFPATVLNAAAAQGAELWRVESRDANTLRLCTYEARLPLLERLARHSGCEVRVLRTAGGRGGLRRILRRPVLLLGIVLLFVLLSLSSLFVWDIEVLGTERLSRGQVLRALEDSGFRCGSFWPGVNTENLKSDVMVKLPQIGWMTVNVSGSRAVVALQERAEKPEIYGENTGLSLAASRDGLVRRVNVLAGTPLVRAGQIVTKGERLIASEMESITAPPRFVQARGSVMAETWYELNALHPRKETLKSGGGGMPRNRFALIFGKRRVNLYIGSGNPIDGYDKIISEFTLGLPGLFSTPIRLVRERFVPYKTVSGSDYDPAVTARRLYALLESRTEGQILSYSIVPGKSGELQVLTLRAHCTENIARPEASDG